MDFLGNMASGPLLALLAIPLAGAAIFTVVIVINLSRRNKKSQMKLGIQPRKSSEERRTDQPTVSGLDTSVLSPTPPTSKPEPELTSVGPVVESAPGLSDPRPIAAGPSPSEVQEKVDLAARLEHQSAAATPPRLASDELMRLARHGDSGELVVEVGGHRYAKLTEVTDKRVGEYILKLAAHLLAFTNGMIQTEAGLKSVYNPRVGDLPEPIAAPSSSPHLAEPPVDKPSEPVPAEGSPYVPKPSPEAEAAFLASLKAETNPPEQPRPRGGGLFRRSRPGPEPILPSLNLAEEINRIVQARLLVSPLAATTDIEITDDLSGGIRIKVNGVPYPSLDAVPDPEARALIKASIKQWERS
jgi:hypothetical protein